MSEMDKAFIRVFLGIDVDEIEETQEETSESYSTSELETMVSDLKSYNASLKERIAALEKKCDILKLKLQRKDAFLKDLKGTIENMYNKMSV